MIEWNPPTDVIPMTTIEATVKGFLGVLKMTRCPSKFALWRSSTTETAWRWGDSIINLSYKLKLLVLINKYIYIYIYVHIHLYICVYVYI
jgi:hypothetical protein